MSDVAEVLAGILDPTIVFASVRVIRRSRCWITNLPEMFNEAVAIGVAREINQDFLFLISDDVSDVTLEPFLISLRQRLPCACREHRDEKQNDNEAPSPLMNKCCARTRSHRRDRRCSV